MRLQIPRLVSAAILAWVTWTVGSATAAAQPPHHPVNFSFFYPISTNQNPEISTNFRLNLLYGRVGAVHGLDLSGVVARTGQAFRGVEIAGAVSVVGGELRGAAYTGGLSYIGSDVRGAQAAGLVNFNRGRLWGFQYASLFNYVEKGFVGLQLTGMYNLNSGDGRYLQIASIVNANAGAFVGAQLTGGINFTNAALRGVQIGLFGFADSLQGVQVGLTNIARQARGAQIGVLNITRQMDGVPFGAVNLVDEGGEEGWVALGSNLAAFSAGARTAYRGFYSMLTVGIGDVQEDQLDTVFLGWHYGHAFELGGTWNLDTDLGYEHILPQPSDEPEVNDRLHFAVQARVLAEVRLSSAIRLFGGTGLNATFSEYSSKAATDWDPLLVAGISFD